MTESITAGIPEVASETSGFKWSVGITTSVDSHTENSTQQQVTAPLIVKAHTQSHVEVSWRVGTLDNLP